MSKFNCIFLKQTYTTSATEFYFAGEDKGYTKTGVSEECMVNIRGGSSGAYPYFYNHDKSVSNYGPYWYASQLGSTYAPCLVVYHRSATAGQRIKVPVKYIRATSP